MRYLLVGNPNVGKSSVFNLLSTTYAHVGNYGGITVDKKRGTFKYGEIIDLPGTYSVAPNSADEGIVTKSIIEDDYDGIINIVDSTHLKRNLHLTIELLEFGKPVIIGLNMMDELKLTGKTIDLDKLSRKLKCQVIGISAKTKSGIDELIETLKTVKQIEPFRFYYGKVIEEAIESLIPLIKTSDDENVNRWKAIQLLEGNSGLWDYLPQDNIDKVKEIVKNCEDEVIKQKIAFSLKGAIFNYRRLFINDVVNECLETISPINYHKEVNRKIDRIITHPFYGLIIFFLVMFGVYFLTFDLLGSVLSDLIYKFIGDYFTPFIDHLLTSIKVKDDSLLRSLILDGVIPGVGGVIIFVPQIAILFLMLAIIEGTGYMARVAIMLDTLFSKFGLNGKAIVPLITGIGCNVPAIMATRTIENKKERFLTIFIIPFMSCSARIPIYSLMATLFFEKHRALIILSMYIIGTIVALVTAKLLSVSIFKTDDNHFIIEIPPYRVPRPKNVLRHTKLMIRDFLEKAGKFILLGTIVIWFLLTLGPNGITLSQDSSFLAYLGKFFAPLFTPLGFGKWEAASSLIVGFMAKELILSSMIEIYGDMTLIQASFTGLSAFSFMVFSLLYLPCLATVGVIHQETKSLKMTLLSLLFTFSVAYVVSFCVYQVGLLFI